MAFDFPAAPTEGQIFSPAGGPTYIFKSPVWQVVTSVPGITTAEARNLLVNPCFQISQENGNVAGAANLYYPADQWYQSYIGMTGAAIARQPRDAFNEYALWFKPSDPGKPTLAAGDVACIDQRIEGIRLPELRWGTANARPLVLRFDCFTGAGGVYSVAVRNSPTTHSWLGTFTSPTTTWTTHTLIIPGDSVGAWGLSNSIGMYLSFTFACGANYLGSAGWQAGNKLGVAGMSNGAATVQGVYIKNVGLYLDPNNTGVPPPWQMPDEAEELLACMRYFQQLYAIVQSGSTSGINSMNSCSMFCPMRVAGPSVTATTAGQASFPAAPGTVAVNRNTVSDQRGATATNAAGYFATNFTLNARM